MPKPSEFRGSLVGKVALITGAGAEGDGVGIGRAIATILAGEGAKVCLVDLQEERALATKRYVEEVGGEAFVSAGDVTSRDDCARFVRETVERFGRIDVLVNNVGVATPVELAGNDEVAWKRVLDINLGSAMLMSRYAVPVMIDNGGGSIINVSSIAGIRAHGSLAYGPSKAAMTALARELAVMYGRQGIRANTVAPGHLLTPMAEALLPPAMRSKRRDVGPLALEGDAWDVAWAVRYLASDEARFVTGVLLPIDGGVTEVAPLVAHAFIEQGP